MYTIRDIARRAGVSSATVSRVINNSDSVKDETKNKIQKVIDELNYTPSAMARGLSTSIMTNIGVAFPDLENPFFSRALRGITERADDLGYNVYLFGTDENIEKEHKFFQVVREQRMRGLIMTPVCESDERTRKNIEELERAGIPVVLLDRDLKGFQEDGIFSDDRRGAIEAIECLIENGNRDIAMIRTPLTTRPGRARYEGYVECLESNNIPMKKEYVVESNFKLEQAYQGAKVLMSLQVPPTAIFTANNMATLGCLKYLNEVGLKIGEDISIIGFDQMDMLTDSGIKLTTVSRPIYEMGREAMNLLESAFCDELKEKRIKRQLMVSTTLELRGSEKHNIAEHKF